MLQTNVLWDDRFTYHEMGYLHPETPRRLMAIKTVLDGDGVGKVVGHLESRAATMDELALVHDPQYIKRVQDTAGKTFTAFDPDTSANAYTWEAASFSAGGTLNCLEAVHAGKVKNAYAFVRPPGHHAERAVAKGFCFFNHAAIGAEWLIAEKRLSRVAVIDFDVHHCNGTQQAFYSRPDVFVASVHRFPFYPGTGAAEEVGEGEGRGATLNIPLDEGATDDDYARALEGDIFPAIERFRPEILIVSAGYDSHVNDPLGGMKMSTRGYRRLMEGLVGLANHCCAGKMVVVLEGGYDIRAVRESVEAQLEVMVEA